MIIHVEISDESVSYLKQLEALGIYGMTSEEVAARFIDKALIEISKQNIPPFMIQTRSRP